MHEVSVEDARRAEISENRERKDFTVEEMYEIYKYLQPKLETEAKERQEATQLQGKDKDGNYMRRRIK